MSPRPWTGARAGWADGCRWTALGRPLRGYALRAPRPGRGHVWTRCRNLRGLQGRGRLCRRGSPAAWNGLERGWSHSSHHPEVNVRPYGSLYCVLGVASVTFTAPCSGCWGRAGVDACTTESRMQPLEPSLRSGLETRSGVSLGACHGGTRVCLPRGPSGVALEPRWSARYAERCGGVSVIMTVVMVIILRRVRSFCSASCGHVARGWALADAQPPRCRALPCRAMP